MSLFIWFLVVCSDWLDGRVAYYLKQANDLGRMVDHSADAVYVAFSLVALSFNSTAHSNVLAILSILITLTFLQYLALSVGGSRQFSASSLGKFNGVFYYIFIGLYLLYLELNLHSLQGFLFFLILLLILTTGMLFLKNLGIKNPS